MDQFEVLVGSLLEAEGYWIRHSFKVNLTKDEKRLIGKPSAPRPEIDILALRHSDNTVIAFEVKSFLDSPGVRLNDLKTESAVSTGRYKLFTNTQYRETVLYRMKQDLIAYGMANKDTTVKLGLAAGKVYKSQSKDLKLYLEERAFHFWSPEEIQMKVRRLATHAYENNLAFVVSKILAEHSS